MNYTLAVVLATIAAVHVINFLVLWADELFFSWKYEDWTKRICCLTAWLAVTLFLLPVLIYRAVQRWRRHVPRYCLYRTLVKGWENWDYYDGPDKVFINSFTTFQNAYEVMERDVKSLQDETETTLKLLDGKQGTYKFVDAGSEKCVMYKIVKR